MTAGHRGGHPDAVQGIPNIPLMSLGEITLRSPSPARAAKGLVYIECQRLRSVAVVDIKPKVIREMAYAVAAAKGVQYRSFE